jgi:hypothetical protein
LRIGYCDIFNLELLNFSLFASPNQLCRQATALGFTGRSWEETASDPSRNEVNNVGGVKTRTGFTGD